jgi:hypothetical protein
VVIIEGGPYLQMAVLCEKVQLDPDGVASIVRVTDEVVIRVGGSTGDWPMRVVSLSLAMSFNAGAACGRHVVRVEPAQEGMVAEVRELELDFAELNRSNNLVIPLDLEVAGDGLHWFDVYLDDTLVTRVPLRIRYEGLRLQA